MKTRRSAGLALWLLISCGRAGESSPVAASSLPDGTVARAGTELIQSDTVQRIATAQGLASRPALELAISDALFAEAARAGLPPGATRSLERAAAARSLLELLGRGAAQAGDPSEAELTEIAHERWVEVARPSAVRTTHAVVINDKPELDAAARALAERVAAAVKGSSTPEEFMRLAQAVPADGFKLRTEALPFVTPDGRTFQVAPAGGFKALSSSFDAGFARVANGLEHPGDVSAVTKSAFGYHVIRLEERAPAAILDPSDLRARVASDVVARRASRSKGELLTKLKQAFPIELDRAVDELTARVEIAP